MNISTMISHANFISKCTNLQTNFKFMLFPTGKAIETVHAIIVLTHSQCLITVPYLETGNLHSGLLYINFKTGLQRHMNDYN